MLEEESAIRTQASEKSEASLNPVETRGMISDPRAGKLMQAGYVVRERNIMTPDGPTNGLSFVKSNGVYRIHVEMIPDYTPLDGSMAVHVRHPETTALTAYDLTGKEPRLFFEARFNAPIQDQMASLRANERYQELRSLARGNSVRNPPLAQLIQDPISYMKQKREADRTRVTGHLDRTSRSMSAHTKPKRNFSMER